MSQPYEAGSSSAARILNAFMVFKDVEQNEFHAALVYQLFSVKRGSQSAVLQTDSVQGILKSAKTMPNNTCATAVLLLPHGT
jgi:hypothetical protein